METCKTCQEKPNVTIEANDTLGVFLRFDCACSQERVALHKIAPIIYRALMAKVI